MPKRKQDDSNRGVNCYKYDEFGVPIPAYMEGFEGGMIAVGPQSLELIGEEEATA